jgi:hypothetical protein
MPGGTRADRLAARLELTREGPFDLAPERFFMTRDANGTKSYDAENEGRPSFRERLLAEVKNHTFGYAVLAIFVVAGPMAAPFLFPRRPLQRRSRAVWLSESMPLSALCPRNSCSSGIDRRRNDPGSARYERLESAPSLSST